MASTIKVDKIEGSTGSTVTIPTGQTLTVTDGLAIGSLPTITVAKGGTNLSSFTAGDLLYATGSTTLAKLPKGTSAQTLKMNSGATAPEWTTVAAASSDCVRLATIDNAGSGTPAYVDMQSVFSATYDFYELYGTDIEFSTDTLIEVSFLVGSTEQTGTYYRKQQFLYGNTATSSAQNEAGTNTDGFHPWGNWNQGTSQTINGGVKMTFLDPYSSLTYPSAYWSVNCHQSAQMIGGTGFGYMGTNIAADGIRIKPASGNFASGRFNLYGFKAS